MDRAEIEFTLAMAEKGVRAEAPADVMAELCRTWLAAQDAPLGTVEVMDERTAGYQVNAVECDHLEIGQRVRIVPDPAP